MSALLLELVFPTLVTHLLSPLEPLQNEVFASRHQDQNSVACIEEKCYVLTFAEYCRWVLPCASGLPPLRCHRDVWGLLGSPRGVHWLGLIFPELSSPRLLPPSEFCGRKKRDCSPSEEEWLGQSWGWL